MSVYPQHVRDEVHRLADEGHGCEAISGRLGVSETTVRRWLDPGYAAKTRGWSREAKRRCRGVCVFCGGPTRYNGKYGRRVSTVCAACNRREGIARIAAERRGNGPVQLQVRAIFAQGVPIRYSYLRDTLQITSNYASVLLNRLARDGWVRRVSRGVYEAGPNLPPP